MLCFSLLVLGLRAFQLSSRQVQQQPCRVNICADSDLVLSLAITYPADQMLIFGEVMGEKMFDLKKVIAGLEFFNFQEMLVEGEPLAGPFSVLDINQKNITLRYSKEKYRIDYEVIRKSNTYCLEFSSEMISFVVPIKIEFAFFELQDVQVSFSETSAFALSDIQFKFSSTCSFLNNFRAKLSFETRSESYRKLLSDNSTHSFVLNGRPLGTAQASRASFLFFPDLEAFTFLEDQPNIIVITNVILPLLVNTTIRLESFAQNNFVLLPMFAAQARMSTDPLPFTFSLTQTEFKTDRYVDVGFEISQQGQLNLINYYVCLESPSNYTLQEGVTATFNDVEVKTERLGPGTLCGLILRSQQAAAKNTLTLRQVLLSSTPCNATFVMYLLTDDRLTVLTARQQATISIVEEPLVGFYSDLVGKDNFKSDLSIYGDCVAVHSKANLTVFSLADFDFSNATVSSAMQKSLNFSLINEQFLKVNNLDCEKNRLAFKIENLRIRNNLKRIGKLNFVQGEAQSARSASYFSRREPAMSLSQKVSLINNQIVVNININKNFLFDARDTLTVVSASKTIKTCVVVFTGYFLKEKKCFFDKLVFSPHRMASSQFSLIIQNNATSSNSYAVRYSQVYSPAPLVQNVTVQGNYEDNCIQVEGGVCARCSDFYELFDNKCFKKISNIRADRFFALDYVFGTISAAFAFALTILYVIPSILSLKTKELTIMKITTFLKKLWYYFVLFQVLQLQRYVALKVVFAVTLAAYEASSFNIVVLLMLANKNPASDLDKMIHGLFFSFLFSTPGLIWSQKHYLRFSVLDKYKHKLKILFTIWYLVEICVFIVVLGYYSVGTLYWVTILPIQIHLLSFNLKEMVDNQRSKLMKLLKSNKNENEQNSFNFEDVRANPDIQDFENLWE